MLKRLSTFLLVVSTSAMLLSGCGRSHYAQDQGELPVGEEVPADELPGAQTPPGSTSDQDADDTSTDNQPSTPDDDNSGNNGNAGNTPDDSGDDFGDDEDFDEDSDIDDEIDDELGEGFDDDFGDDEFDDDFDDDFGSEGTAEGGCGFPYFCVASTSECSSMWEGTPMPSMSCSDEGGICCDPFTGEGGSSSGDEGDETALPPLEGEPITIEVFCDKILECIFPEGSSVNDCHDVYDDEYCGTWSTYLTCMNGCMDVVCSEEDYGTEFVLCEAACFDAYCD